MCKCSRVELREVAYKGSGEQAVPYHKNCGEFLSDSQAKLIRGYELKIWNSRHEYKESTGRSGAGRIKALQCKICQKTVPPASKYCPNCGSTEVETILLRL